MSIFDIKALKINDFNQAKLDGFVTAEQFAPVVQARLDRAIQKKAEGRKTYGREKVLAKALKELTTNGGFKVGSEGEVDSSGAAKMACWKPATKPEPKAKKAPKAEAVSEAASAISEAVQLEIARASLLSNAPNPNGKAVKDQVARLDRMIEMISAA